MKKSFTRFASMLWLTAAMAVCGGVASNAQEPEKRDYVFPQSQYAQGFDNYMMATYYFNGQKTYNLRGYQASYSPGTVRDIKVNPSGTSYVLLTRKSDGTAVTLYDLWKADKVMGRVKKVQNATAIAYTDDARNLVLATPAEILVCDARSLELKSTIANVITASNLIVSPNNYYIAATDGERVVVWNMESKSIRKEIKLDARVNDIAFSNDSKYFAVLADNGTITLYNTHNYLENRSYDGLGYAQSCDFNSDNKYVAVVCSDTRIVVLNLLDDSDRIFINDNLGGITDLRFVSDNHGNPFLIYNTASNVTCRRMSEIKPNFTQLLADELDDKMTDWMKQMPGESMDDYRLRVNDETRVEQMKLFEVEIATRIADDYALAQIGDVSLGSYNPESSMLSVNLGGMEPIFLEVPSEDVVDFTNVDDLEFVNVKYGLTSDDKFELIYADVRNKNTGKTYTYNNLERRSLEFLELEEEFVPLEVIQQSNIQEVVLQEIKDNVVNMAKEQNTISDHTNINVKTNVESSTNADGERIMNYIVDVSYTVEVGFSAQEDFGPGKYKVEDSGAAMSMMEIVKQALEGEFATYMQSGKRLLVKVHGMADSMPIYRGIAYDGCYGEYVGEPVYKDDILSNLTLTKAEGITQNEQLAFVRALGVKHFFANSIKGVEDMNVDYSYNIEVTSGKGGEYRRISMQLVFVDAF